MLSMADISAFRGLRYDLGHVGSLSDVIAPPYDVIDAELQEQLYKKHPANVVRLILNRDEPGDDEHNNRYTRAARLFRTGSGRACCSTSPTRRCTSTTRIQRRRHDVHAAGLHGPRAAGAVRRGEHLSARRDDGGPKEDRLKLLTRLQGEPQPDLWPVSRSGERGAEHSGSGDRGRRAAGGDRPSGRRASHVAGDRRGDDHRGERRDGRPAGCSSPTAITATRRPATIATIAAERPSGGSLPSEHPANFVLMMCVR